MIQAILTSRPLSLNPMSWVNAISRFKTGYPIDHIAIRNDDVIYESSAPDGVCKFRYDDWIKTRSGTTIFVFDLPEDYLDFEVFYKFYDRHTKYDYWANVLILFNKKNKLKKKANKRQFCSELFANMAGYKNPEQWDPGMVMVELSGEGFNLKSDYLY